MRQRNWRMVIGGFILLVLALGFAFFMSSIASISTDPVELMRIGQNVQHSLFKSGRIPDGDDFTHLVQNDRLPYAWQI